MSLPTEFALYPIFLGSLIAVMTDLLRGKIYNSLTFPLLGAGLVYAVFTGGFAGLGQALLGAGAGLVLYGWMYALRFMGAGDVKLLMAFGAWGGPEYAARVALLGIWVGGGLAVIALLARGRLGGFVNKIYRFGLSLAIQQLEVEVPKLDRKLTMPFGVAIAVASIWVAVSDPLVRLGIWL